MLIKHIHTNTIQLLFFFDVAFHGAILIATWCIVGKRGNMVKSVCWEVQHVTWPNNDLCGRLARINETWVANQIRCIHVHHGRRATGHVQVVVLTRREHDHTLAADDLAKYIVKGVVVISQLQRGGV